MRTRPSSSRYASEGLVTHRPGAHTFLRALALITVRNHTNHAMTGPTSDAKARGEDPPDKEMGMETLATVLLAVGGSSARR